MTKTLRYTLALLLFSLFFSCKKNEYAEAIKTLDNEAIYMATSSLQSVHNIWAFADFVGRKNYFYGTKNFDIAVDSSNLPTINTTLKLPLQNSLLYYYDSTKTKGTLTFSNNKNYPAVNSIMRIECNNFFTMGHYFSGFFYAQVLGNAAGLRTYKIYGDSFYVKLNAENVRLKLDITTQVNATSTATSKLNGKIETITQGNNQYKLEIDNTNSIAVGNDYDFKYSLTGSKFYYFNKGKAYCTGLQSKGTIVYGVSNIKPNLATFTGDNTYRFGIEIFGF